MKRQLVPRNSQQTHNWTGGTTTELVIYPIDSKFTDYNFDFRISTATVEKEESTFTFMPGVMRHLMILNGKLSINHTDRYKKEIHEFDQDIFNGEWPTTAKGKVRDFNLLLRNKATGYIEHHSIIKKNTHEISANNSCNYIGFYVVSGELKINHEVYFDHLTESDFILFSEVKNEKFTIEAIQKCEMLVVYVNNI